MCARMEQVMIDTLGEFGIAAGRMPGATGVWVDGAKSRAIGVHISRWVTSHGFALNLDTDLSYFQYIVPCGLTTAGDLACGSSGVRPLEPRRKWSPADHLPEFSRECSSRAR